MNYVPHTDDDRRAMMDTLGITTMQELFADIPASIAYPHFDLPAGADEETVRRRMKKLSRTNSDLDALCSFLGAGAYHHYIPATVDAVLQRSEFFTAYTPYQAEMSQGTLQAIYEYQSMICLLTGMDVSNASLYDGGTALAESMILARNSTRRSTILVCTAVNPLYREVLATYANNLDFQLVEIPHKEGHTDIEALIAGITNTTALCIVQNPNFFGTVADYTELADALHTHKALLAISAYPISLGVVKSPGEMGADIAAGEAQSLGIALNYGGPYLGYLAVRKKLVRKMPGRLVGATTDTEGDRGFVLTLQAREQHIRREKATSNICSNQALCALAASVYMASVGKNGLKTIALANIRLAFYARQQLQQTGVVTLPWDAAVFNEFVIETTMPATKLLEALAEKNIIGGLALHQFYKGYDNRILVNVTEINTVEDIDMFVAAVKEVLA